MSFDRASSDRFTETCDAIRRLDLRRVRDALIAAEGMTPDEADAAIAGYRRFLVLHAAHPDHPLAPPANADKAWHHHILDTSRYAADCERIFGHFLHHDPAPARLQEGRALLARLLGTVVEAGPCVGLHIRASDCPYGQTAAGYRHVPAS